jgi:hypothetical protein
MHEYTATSLLRPRIAYCTAILGGAEVKPGSRYFSANSTFIASYVIFSCFNYRVQCNQQLEFNERNLEGMWRQGKHRLLLLRRAAAAARFAFNLSSTVLPAKAQLG